MSNSIANTINSRLRLSGLSSGLDTESMITQLMKAESAKLDKVKQDRQLLQWKQDNYRDMTNLLRGFKDDFLDVLKPASNMRSQSNYKIYSTSSSNTGVAVSASSSAIPGSHSITVTQLATAASSTGSTEANAVLQSAADINDMDFTNKDFNITLNGVTRNIKLTNDYTGDIAQLRTDLQTVVNSAFGENNITIGGTGDKISISGNNNKISLASGTSDALSQMNISSGATNRLNLTQNLSQMGFATALSGTISFKINDVSFSFDTTSKSMTDVISEINSSSANVTMGYSEATGKFTLTSKVMGAGNAINIEDSSGQFFGSGSATQIDVGAVNNGKDAVFNLDGVNDIHRNSNIFTIDGVNYTLTDKVTSTVTVTQDVNGIYDKIKAFVDKYNDVISKLNTELSEDYDRDYAPLTDDQKSSMSEDDIKKWEEKAKTGLLRNDSIISNVVNSMRKTLSDAVSGISGTLNSIGISTGTYSDKGKLTIDETKLKEAIKNTPDKVMNFFAKESSTAYSPDLSAADKAKRYNESGFVNRIYDIIQDNTRTIRDANGKKGILLEKAGIKGDLSEYANLMTDALDDKDTAISTLVDKLAAKEEYYYKKFSAMETALSKMNSQSAWLSQQFGTSSS